MVIRAEQMAVFDRAARNSFVKELAGYIRDRHGDNTVRLPDKEITVSAIPNADLEQMVQKGIERAASYGISWKSTQASFVVAMFVAAPNFDADPFVRSLLMEKGVEPNRRMDYVARRLTRDNWDSLRRGYDVSAWGLSHA